MSSVGFDKSGRRFACRPYSQTISAKDFVADKYVDEESGKVENREQKVEKTSKPLSENPQKVIKNTVKKVEIPKNEQINIDTPVEPVREKATDIPMLSLVLAEKSEEEQQEQETEDEEIPIIEQKVEEEPIIQEEKEPVVERKEESAPLSQPNTDDDLFDLGTLIVENTDALIKSAEREQEQEKKAYEYPKEIINEPIENIEDERDLPLRKEYTETEYQRGYDPEYDEYPEDYYEEDERYSDEYYEDEEDYDEEDEEEERGPLTVKDYKLIYYYRTMTLIIILLVILLICVIYMSMNDITIADLIPDKVKAIQSSRYFKKLISLIQGMK